MIDMFVAAMLAVLKFQTLYLILPNSPDLSAVVSGCKMVTGVIVRDKMQRNVFRLTENLDPNTDATPCLMRQEGRCARQLISSRQQRNLRLFFQTRI